MRPFVKDIEARERERQLAAIRADVTVRLRSVCAQWPADEVERLVERIAELTYKYDRARTMRDVHPTD